MPLRGPQTPRDPIYSSKGHKANVKHWRLVQAPCALCHNPIDYTGPTRIGGTVNPWSLEVDHIVSVVIARAQGWTTDQINALSNTRPTHQRCNSQRGLRLGQRRAHTKRRATKRSTGWPIGGGQQWLDTTREW